MKQSATGCSVEESMRLLGGRWRLLMVSYLLDGPKRFNDLRRDLPGISQRMLTLDLRALEDAGLIQRTVFPEVPVRVEYQLTEDGDRLRPIIDVMRDFGLWLKANRATEAARPDSELTPAPIPSTDSSDTRPAARTSIPDTQKATG
jgi:DNA-binding HxlR family transcriptional regulator